MNLDIRVSVDFFEHHKTRKLIRRLGYEAVFCLQRLWAYAAKHRCDGVLYDMDAEDIIIASGWNGGEEFPAALQEIGFMEAVPSPELDGTNVATNVVRWLYVLHDWREHNSYAADDKRRSEAGRFSRLARTNPEICADLRKNGITSLSADDYQGLRKGVLTVNQIVLRSYNDSPEKPCERTTPDTKDQRPKTLKPPPPTPQANELPRVRIRSSLRQLGTNPRALGTNSRSQGTNPRSQGTNPRTQALPPKPENPKTGLEGENLTGSPPPAGDGSPESLRMTTREAVQLAEWFTGRVVNGLQVEVLERLCREYPLERIRAGFEAGKVGSRHRTLGWVVTWLENPANGAAVTSTDWLRRYGGSGGSGTADQGNRGAFPDGVQPERHGFGLESVAGVSRGGVKGGLAAIAAGISCHSGQRADSGRFGTDAGAGDVKSQPPGPGP